MSALWRRVRSDDQSSDDGFTLIELMVAMAIMVVLGGAMTATMTSVARHDVTSTSRIRATEQAQVIIDRLTKDLRAAAVPAGGTGTPVSYADANNLTLYADFTDGNGTRKIAVTVTGGPLNATLAEDTTLASATGTYTGTAQHRVDSTDVNVSSGSLFTYYAADNSVLTAPVSAPGQIVSVGINLVSQEPGLSVPVTLTTRVYLRNAQYH
jgi:prepilin-type N-terminal cleavage/methylation domain-containing protein